MSIPEEPFLINKIQSSNLNAELRAFVCKAVQDYYKALIKAKAIKHNHVAGPEITMHPAPIMPKPERSIAPKPDVVPPKPTLPSKISAPKSKVKIKKHKPKKKKAKK